jgi:hypothetical protein
VKLKTTFIAAVLIIAAVLGGQPAPAAQTQTVEDRVWSLPRGTNGWFPKLSPSGEKIVYGFWGTTYTNLATGETRALLDPEGGRLNPMGFLDENTIIAHTEERGGKVYAFKVGEWVARHIADNGAASWSHAQDGHWALTVANRPVLTRDGQPFPFTPIYGQVRLAGNYTVIAHGETYNTLVFNGHTLERELPSDNMWSVNAHGDVASGYFGECKVYPKGQGLTNCTIAPTRREGVPALVRVNGELWIWTATEMPPSTGIHIMGRRLGETDPILLLDFPSVWTEVVWNGTHFVVAGNNTDGALQVRWVKPGAKRTKLAEIEVPKTQCNDGQDNDGDTRVDMADPGCKSAEDNDESPQHFPEAPKLTKDFGAHVREQWAAHNMDSTIRAAKAQGSETTMRAYVFFLAAVAAQLAGQGAGLQAQGQGFDPSALLVKDSGKVWRVEVVKNDAPAWNPTGEVAAGEFREAKVQTPGLPGFVCQILKEERAKFSRINDPADLSDILNRTAYRANGNKVEGDWGLSTKRGGNRCPSPGSDTNTDIACDILHRRSDNIIWDVLGSAGVGEKSEPNCGEALGPMGDGSRPWVSASVPPGQEPKVEVCGNKVDDDGDGQVDEGCPVEPKVELCGNGVDDNGNGQVDEGCPTGGGSGDLDAVLEMLASLEARLQGLELQHAAILQAIADIPKAQVSDAKIDELIATVNQERVVTFRLLGQNVTAVIKEGKK